MEDRMLSRIVWFFADIAALDMLFIGVIPVGVICYDSLGPKLEHRGARRRVIERLIAASALGQALTMPKLNDAPEMQRR
jgi:hypothetical protein